MNALRNRRSIRLKNYDYSQNGAYFVTICTHQRMNLFGHVVDDAMVLNTWGEIVAEEWERTAALRPNVELDGFVVMPNHVHMILVIVDDGRGMARHAPTGDSNMRHAPTGDSNMRHAPTGDSNMRHAPTGDSNIRHAPTGDSDIPGTARRAPTREFGKPIARSLPTIVGAFKSAVTKRINRLPDAPEHPVWQRNYYEHIIRSEESLQFIRAYVAHNPAKWAEDTLYKEQP